MCICVVYVRIYCIFQGSDGKSGRNEYANFANPEQRQEAYPCNKDHIQMPLPQQQVPFLRQPLRQPHPIQPRPPQQRAAKPHPYQPHPAQQQVPQSHISRQPWLPTCLCV